MRCPRKPEGPFVCNDHEDTWRDNGTCSYCGSLNPDTLMQRLEAGDVELGPTDKGYKVYVENSGGEALKVSCGKFYFVHFSEEQMKRFIELMNEKRLKIGMPGHFYVLPYFIQMGPPKSKEPE